MSAFGERLRRLRLERELSQRELGAALGVGNTTVSQWENEVNEPGQDMLVRLARFFSVSIDYLLGRTDLRLDVGISPRQPPADLPEDVLEAIRRLPPAAQKMMVLTLKEDLTPEDWMRYARLMRSVMDELAQKDARPDETEK